MTLVPPDHIHITEREPDGTWEDCTWCAGLMWYRLVYDASKPATRIEAEAIRAASGEPPTGGSNIGNLRDGFRRHYAKTVALPKRSFSELQAALTNNRVAAAQGSMKAFGPSHRLSKWDRYFDQPHCVTIMNFNGKLLWADPEAPAGTAPVEVTWAEVKAYVTALPGAQHLVGPIKNIVGVPDTSTEEPVGTSFTPGKAERGTATTTRAISLIDVATSDHTPVPVGYVRTTSGLCVIKDGPYAQKTAYLCSMGGRAQLLLTSAATYVPDPPPIVKPDPAVIKAAVDAAVKVDRTKAYVAYKP